MKERQRKEDYKREGDYEAKETSVGTSERMKRGSDEISEQKGAEEEREQSKRYETEDRRGV